MVLGLKALREAAEGFHHIFACVMMPGVWGLLKDLGVKALPPSLLGAETLRGVHCVATHSSMREWT